MIKFGTDGWRAIIAESFTFENVKIVSQAVADYLQDLNKKKKKVVIGYDCRFLSKEFAQTCARVLVANKIKVTLSDRAVPTPTVSFHSLHGKYDLGIMITASHNPYQFNGLKIKTYEGAAADNILTDKVESFLHKNKPEYIEKKTARNMKDLKEKDLTREYINFLKGFVDIKKINKLKLNVLVDNMYGSGGRFVEQILYRQSNIKVDYIHDDFNPSFKGVHPEPVVPNLGELIAKVKKEGYNLGVALDGDADRVAVVDKSGNFISAQVILPLLAVHMIKNRKQSGGIGKTVVGSNLIDEVAQDYGVACYETPVGFKHISNLFKQGLICIGGEEAGGIGYKGYVPERDGNVSFLLLLEMLAVEKKDFSSLMSSFYKKYGKWYYNRISIPVKSMKKSLEKLKLPSKLLGRKIQRINTLDGIKLITDGNWLMFRKSGTEPIVRIYAESRKRKEVDKLLALGKRMVYAL